jgi:RNA polymerase sigma-70 factor (ECF subfamily)
VEDSSKSQWITNALDVHEASLIRYATWILGDVEQAREVVQETFLRLCREKDPVRLDGYLAQWLFTVCRNIAFDTRKKEARMKPAGNVESLNSGVPPRQTVGDVFRLLDGLPKNQREVVYLKFQCDLSYKEISEVTSLTVSNVGFLIHTALKNIRKQVLSEPLRRTQ